MKHSARPYQAAAVQAVLKAWETHQSVLVVMPTASGKSFVFSDLVRRMQPKRSLILANRGELLFQAARHVQRTGLETAIEKADLYADTGLFNRAPVVVASVQTMISMEGIARRMHKWNPKDFGLIVCDEAHLFCAPSFRSILSYFKHGNPEIKIFGCTATPKRADEVALGEVFDHCAFQYEIEDAINDGWLVPVSPLGLRVESLDFSGVGTTKGDLNGADLAAVMEAEKPLYGIAQGTLESVFYLEPNTLHGVPVEKWRSFLVDNSTPPRSALCFTVSVRHSEMLSDIFNRVVPGIADYVFGKTPDDRRMDINSRFKSGELPILVNCGTHTTGVDVPKAEVIVPKPTKSHTLALQMYGRGFRPAEVSGRSIVDQYPTAEERRLAISRSKKPRCVILDFHGVSGRHKLITPFDILGGRHSDEVIKLAIENSRTRNAPVDMTEEMRQAELEMAERIKESRIREASRKGGIIRRARFSVSSHDLFDRYDAGPMAGAERTERVVTPGMAGILRKAGIDSSGMPYVKALQLVREQFGKWNKYKKLKTNNQK